MSLLAYAVKDASEYLYTAACYASEFASRYTGDGTFWEVLFENYSYLFSNIGSLTFDALVYVLLITPVLLIFLGIAWLILFSIRYLLNHYWVRRFRRLVTGRRDASLEEDVVFIPPDTVLEAAIVSGSAPVPSRSPLHAPCVAIVLVHQDGRRVHCGVGCCIETGYLSKTMDYGIITATHVVEQANFMLEGEEGWSCAVVSSSGKSRRFEFERPIVVSPSNDLDIVVFGLDRNLKSALGLKSVKMGRAKASACVVASVVANKTLSTYMSYGMLDAEARPYSELRHDAATTPGISGAPIFTRGSGTHLVGIHCGHRVRENWNYGRFVQILVDCVNPVFEGGDDGPSPMARQRMAKRARKLGGRPAGSSKLAFFDEGSAIVTAVDYGPTYEYTVRHRDMTDEEFQRFMDEGLGWGDIMDELEISDSEFEAAPVPTTSMVEEPANNKKKRRTRRRRPKQVEVSNSAAVVTLQRAQYSFGAAEHDIPGLKPRGTCLYKKQNFGSTAELDRSFDRRFKEIQGMDKYAWPPKAAAKFRSAVSKHHSVKPNAKIDDKLFGEAINSFVKNVEPFTDEFIDSWDVKKQSYSRKLFDELWPYHEDDVNLKSSPGYPWCLDYSSNAEFLESERTLIKEAVWERLHVKSLANVKPSQYFEKGFTDAVRIKMKDEVMSKKKIAEGRLRNIACCSLVDQMFDRFVFTSFLKTVTGRKYHTECCSGIGFEECGATDFVEKLALKPGEYLVGSDVRGWETGYTEQYMRGCGTVVERLYKGTSPVFQRLLWNRIEDLVRPVYEVHGSLYESEHPGKMISGIRMTTEFNSIARRLVAKCALSKVSSRTGRAAGDDNLDVISQKITPELYVKLHADLGVTLTDVVITPYKGGAFNFEFCSHKWRVSPYGKTKASMLRYAKSLYTFCTKSFKDPVAVEMRKVGVLAEFEKLDEPERTQVTALVHDYAKAQLAPSL